MRFLLPKGAADRAQAAGSSGALSVRIDQAEGLVVIVSLEAKNTTMPAQTTWLDTHYMRSHGSISGVGVWYRADPALHDAGLEWAIRGGSVPTAEFRELVRGWRFPPDIGWPVLTLVDREGGEWQAWWVDKNEAHLLDLEVVADDLDLLAPLDPGWPRAVVGNSVVAIVGLGSIGSAAAFALARFAVRALKLVDNQRLEQRNFARHQAHPRDLGRWKTRAVADALTGWDTAIDVTTAELDVLDQTHILRPTIKEADVVVVATDGVATRRVLNHVGIWARTPCVFAAVLENGAIGEVSRVLPNRTGCLICHRDTLYEQGGLDPEPGLDQGYEVTGGARPMTAVGGDLALVGAVAAKIAVATLLEAAGFREAALPGDHLAIGLRPAPDLGPPFDIERTLECRWSDVRRRDECISCAQLEQ